MRAVAVLLSVVLLVAAPVARAAEAGSHRALPAADVSFPFWCDWGYDWDERCYWDDSARLAVGGEVDKVWRAGLRFDLSRLPEDVAIVSATLNLYFDGTCVGRWGSGRRCDGRSYAVDAHPILTGDWFGEREVEFGDLLDTQTIATATGRRWVAWDVTEAVAAWAAGAENAGLLVKLADGQEDFAASGPNFASGTFADPAVRPILDVVYAPLD